MKKQTTPAIPVKDENEWNKLDINDPDFDPTHKPTPVKDEGYEKNKLVILDESFNNCRIGVRIDKSHYVNVFATYNDLNNAKENAERLLECWNNYDAVLAANKELVEALKDVVDYFPNTTYKESNAAFKKAKETIQKHPK